MIETTLAPPVSETHTYSSEPPRSWVWLSCVRSHESRVRHIQDPLGESASKPGECRPWYLLPWGFQNLLMPTSPLYLCPVSPGRSNPHPLAFCVSPRTLCLLPTGATSERMTSKCLEEESGQGAGPRARVRPGCEVAAWPWAACLPTRSPSLLICKTGVMITSTSQAYQGVSQDAVPVTSLARAWHVAGAWTLSISAELR